VRIVIGVVTLLVATIYQATDGEVTQKGRTLGTELDGVVVNSDWKNAEAGLKVAMDRESFQAAKSIMTGRGKLSKYEKVYDPKYVYLFVFGGYTDQGPAKVVEVRRVWMSDPVRNGGSTIHVDIRVKRSGRILAQERSPCRVVKLARAALPNIVFALDVEKNNEGK
jgi:hypothetical protein